MHRAIPIGNMICHQRNVERNQALHREKIKTIKGQIDTKEPETCQLVHVRQNLKREQMLKERYREIDTENRILLQKMLNTNMRQPEYKEKKLGPTSLNRDLRKLELNRITHENQAILKRLQKARPVYSHAQWEKDHKQSLEYMKNAALYPVVDYDVTDAAKTKNDFRAIGTPNHMALPMHSGTY